MKKFLLLAAFIAACASGTGDTQDLGRWRAYSGCGESQCRSWNSACEAECMNQSSRKHLIDGEVCLTQCREKMNACNQSCAQKPGAQ